MLKQKFHILIAHQKGKNITTALDQLKANNKKKVALVLSNEAHGVSEKTRLSVVGNFTEVSIPIRSVSKLPESYNVSAAASMLMYEITKK